VSGTGVGLKVGVGRSVAVGTAVAVGVMGSRVGATGAQAERKKIRRVKADSRCMEIL